MVRSARAEGYGALTLESQTHHDLLFTVMTPTFNRAHTLTRVYESLKRQTFQSFEWLVVDDGSTDETRERVRAWLETTHFPIRYFYQPNSGKGVCENKAAEVARGRLLAVLDSDDWYVPTALETFAIAWDSIDARERNRFVGIVALCVDPAGAVIGDRFPADVLDTTYTELRGKYRVRGDKAGCARIEIMRQFPFPVFAGERALGGPAEGTVYRRIAREYGCRCVNQVVVVKDYQADGLSATVRRSWIASPRTAKLFRLESLLDNDLTALPRVWSYAQHFRFAIHARLIRQSWVDSPSKLSWLVAAPLGAALYLRDRLFERGRG